jgi:hypothetical protein
VDDAMKILVSPNQDFSGLNFSLSGVPVHSVRFSLSKTSAIPFDLPIRIATLPIRIETRMIGHDGIQAPFTLDYDSIGDNTYVVPRLAPGEYSIDVTWGPGLGPLQPIVHLSPTIVDRDINLGAIDVAPFRTVTGRVRMTGSDIPATIQAMTIHNWNSSLGLDLVPVAADGTFSASVPEGRYRFTLTLPPDNYVASVQYGSKDVLHTGLVINGDNGDPAGPVNIEIATGVGEVHGVVRNVHGDLIAGARVILLPNLERRTNSELIRSKTSDAAGAFSFSDIPPDDYSVLALEKVSDRPYDTVNATRNAAFMKPFENQETKIHVGKGEKKSITLRIVENFK